MNLCACPHCMGVVQNTPQIGGRLVVCPHCTRQFDMPPCFADGAATAARPHLDQPDVRATRTEDTARTPKSTPGSYRDVARIGPAPQPFRRPPPRNQESRLAPPSAPQPTATPTAIQPHPSEASATAVQQHWCYMLEGFLNDDLEGPVSEEEFLREIHAGRIGPKAKVMSPSVTKGAWVRLKTFPSYVRIWEEGKFERQRRKHEEAQEKQRQRELKSQKAKQDRLQAAAAKPDPIVPFKTIGVIFIGILLFFAGPTVTVALIGTEPPSTGFAGLLCGTFLPFLCQAWSP